jgi:hypothetical protein
MTEDDIPYPASWHREIPLEPPNDKFETEMLSEALAGITGYHSTKCGVLLNPYFRPEVIYRAMHSSRFNPLETLQGSLRYLWSILSAINDIPTEVQHVTASKGFVARGRYRKFCDHSVITLNVPHKEYQKVAKKAVAGLHRRAHMVRGHWRRDYRHPGGRFWIKEHQRGDASLGFVLHDYKVTHDIEPTPHVEPTPDGG